MLVAVRPFVYVSNKNKNKNQTYLLTYLLTYLVNGRRYLVALSPGRSDGIAGAMLTAHAAGQLPVISLAAVTALAEHIGQTDALAGDAVTRTGRPVCAQNVAHARCVYTHTANTYCCSKEVNNSPVIRRTVLRIRKKTGQLIIIIIIRGLSVT